MEYKKWLTYWKKSLSDSLKADISIDKLHHFEVDSFEIDIQQLEDFISVNNLIDFEEARINKKKGALSKESENWVALDEVQVLISPIKIKPTTENLVFLKDKQPKFPFWYFAKLDRSGRLEVPEEYFPVFQRKYLEPLADERTEFVFGTVENIDNATAVGQEQYVNYQEYIDYVKDVFVLAINQNIEDYKTEGYETLKNATILLPDEDINAAIGIIHLYEKILKEDTIPELLKTFITLNNSKENNPLTVSEFIDSNFLHTGQMGFDFPISISQRKSLNTFLKTNDKVFAVNGPPGTGKTTLLQSIVANKFVESAIKGNQPFIILACSTNNQAVTNIIDSFSKSNTKPGNLEGRWLPEIEGYATYLPANGKTEAELEGINYKKQYGDGLFNRVENDSYLKVAKPHFIEKCSKYFEDKILNINDAIKKIQKEIVNIKTILNEASNKWKEYLKNEDLFLNGYLNNSGIREKYYSEKILSEIQFQSDIEILNKLEEKIISYFNSESFFRKLFCFFGLKSALANRVSEVRILLRDSLISETREFVYTKSAILEKIDHKITTGKKIIESINNWKEWKISNSITGNPPKTEEEYWEFEYLKIKNGAKPNCFYDELDVTLRHEAFQLALHYWEGRWLLKLESDLGDENFDRKGFDATKNRWQRQAMLTPCFVSTFYMAPKFFSYFRFFKKGEDGKNIYDTPPLYGFIDLLIVDEAGQVSPEVGTATFSLAKQAVIVGDVKQIEPVWNITNKIDIGNLKKCNIIKSYDDLIYEKEFDPKGFLASTGSIMKMAQNASNIRQSGEKEKGVTLVEHRRCFDEIINYCNVLAYDGKLVPLKGPAKSDLLFPSMYCIHVEGNSTVKNSSRYNDNEVNAIVNWLVKNKTKIEEKYGKVEDSIGIITPFVGQKNNLKYALKNAGFNIDALKLGTVHALQGAERSIVLFSMVYGKGDSGTMFFDRDNKPNMLNVAVSRAKDNFVVFANTEILDKKSKTPSGILSNHLTYETNK
ncbi:ATP-binding protein [Flavobacterium sp. B183]|uniref:DEAD/DEAH box helicase n=1 Tax=Flavobacterium sp. B183 TaxID=907046 RepID=UPI00201EBEA0|nr:AAA domain-containing protein [Flavobacterium sp. B183]URC12352.1 AAA domain-containing protein [Flavobacterium sp. B183]